jgi:hypothetical protein
MKSLTDETVPITSYKLGRPWAEYGPKRRRRDRKYFVPVKSSGGVLGHGKEILGFIRGEWYLLKKDC